MTITQERPLTPDQLSDASVLLPASLSTAYRCGKAGDPLGAGLQGGEGGAGSPTAGVATPPAVPTSDPACRAPRGLPGQAGWAPRGQDGGPGKGPWPAAGQGEALES